LDANWKVKDYLGMVTDVLVHGSDCGNGWGWGCQDRFVQEMWNDVGGGEG